MSKSPAFQFYPKDWLSESRITRMSLQAQGAYMRILCHMWNDSKDQCSITGKCTELALILRVSEKKMMALLKEIQQEGDPILMEKGGRLVSKRLKVVKRQQVRNSRVKVEAGKKGAAKRWQGHKSATVLPVAKNGPSTPSPTPPPPPGGGVASLVRFAQDRNVAARKESLEIHVAAWVARSSLDRVNEILADEWTPGKSIIEIQDHFFPRDKTVAFKPKVLIVPEKSGPPCQNCELGFIPVLEVNERTGKEETRYTQCPKCKGKGTL